MSVLQLIKRKGEYLCAVENAFLFHHHTHNNHLVSLDLCQARVSTSVVGSLTIAVNLSF